jgi:hypothetical protein
MAADMVANGLKLDLYGIDLAGRDSHNWYANLEISYVLQKREE